MTWRFAWFTVSASILGLSFAACGDENDIEVHTPIWGYVTGPDGPLRARVSASGEYPTYAFAHTDANGRYELPVAPGSYTLGVTVADFFIYYLEDGSFGLQGTPARVELEPLANPLRMDIRLSSARVTVERLDYWEGREIAVAFGGADTTARVVGGAAAFDLPVVAPGNHFLELDEAFVPGTHLRDGATRFSVAAGERAEIHAAMTVEPTLVDGTLLDPLEFARELRCRIPERSIYVNPDSTGRFSIALWGSSVSFEVGRFGLSHRMDGVADVFSLVPGEILELPPFVLPGVSVTPAGLLSEEIQFWIRENPADSVWAWGDDWPPYVLGPLPLGRYLLGAEHSWPCLVEWVPTRCDSTELCDAVSIELGADSPFPTVSFPLRKGAAIEGVILGAVPWRLREVRLWQSGKLVCPNSPVYEDLTFSLSGLFPGSYQIQFEYDDHRLLWYPGVESDEEAEVIEIRENEELIWIEMTWPEP